MFRVVQGETVHIELICHIAEMIPNEGFGQSLIRTSAGADNSRVIGTLRPVGMCGSNARFSFRVLFLSVCRTKLNRDESEKSQ